MRGSAGLIVVVFRAAMPAIPGAFAAGQTPNVDEFRFDEPMIDELNAPHDKGAPESVGDNYLEQELLHSIRALRAQDLRDVEQQVETVRPFDNGFKSALI